MTRFYILILVLSGFFSLRGQAYKKIQDEAAAECENGNFSRAIELSDKALELAIKDKSAGKEEVLSLRSENAAYYLLSEQVDKGLQLFEPLLREVEGGGLPKAELNVRQNYGIALVFLNRHRDAAPQLQRVMEHSRTQRMKTEDLVSTVGSLAVCYQNVYEFSKAEKTFLEALEILRREKLENTVEHAFMLSNLALLYKDMKLPEKSLVTYTKAETAFEKAKDTLNPQFPVFLTEYASMLAETGQFEKALKLSFRARNIDRQIYTENSTEYSSALNNIGFIYSEMNRIIETEQFYEEAIRIKKTLPYLRYDSYYTSVSNLMNFYNRVGRTAEAGELAAELEKGLQNTALVDTLKRAVFANNLAIYYLQHDAYARAQTYFKDALRYYEAVYGPENPYKAEIYINMGTLFQVQEKYEDCADYLNRAAEEYRKRSLGGSAEDINTLCNLVMILKGVDKSDVAEQYVNQALGLSGKYKVKDETLLEQLYIAKAQIAADLDKVKESMDYFNKFLELKYGQIEQNFSYMTENEKLFFLEQFELSIRNFYTTILNNIEKYPELIKALLDFRLKTKAFLLNNLSKIKQRLYELKDPALNQKFEDLKLKREAVAKLMNFDTEEYPYALAEATTLKAEADKLEKEISLKVTGSGGSGIRSMDWRQLQKLLGPGEAAIEIFQSYLIYDKGRGKGTNYTYIILKQTGDPIAVSIDREIKWEEEVLTLYRNSINLKKDEPDLYRRLWQAVDEKLAGISTVYISPDGIYNQVNLNTLLHGPGGRYLLEEKNIHLLTSLRDLKEIRQGRHIKPENSILVGNPKFDYDLTKLSYAKNDLSTAVATRGAFGFVLSELPGTKEEVEVIKSTLEKNGMHAALFTEINANEHDIKKIKNPDVLHIATHGFFLEDPKEEDLMGYSRMERDYYSNPMLRSGIFFSGANKTYAINTANINLLADFEDGMLTAYEAMNLNLDETELVVLSACQTGLGKVKNGEGVYGLQRAFKLAGARAIIMSLWPVSDEATKDLMIAFYGAWTKTGKLYDAFKEAQLEVKKKYPQPYYWGAFVLNGK